MPQTSKAAKSPPADVEQALIRLGSYIRKARLRRNKSLEELAETVGVTRHVMAAIEKGKPSTAIASYMGALWAMGLLSDMKSVADPDHDTEGKALENARAPKTAGKRTKELDNDF